MDEKRRSSTYIDLETRAALLAIQKGLESIGVKSSVSAAIRYAVKNCVCLWALMPSDAGNADR